MCIRDRCQGAFCAVRRLHAPNAGLSGSHILPGGGHAQTGQMCIRDSLDIGDCLLRGVGFPVALCLSDDFRNLLFLGAGEMCIRDRLY